MFVGSISLGTTRPGESVAILLETKGPEIRIGLFGEYVGNTIDLKQGQGLKLLVDCTSKGDNICIAVCVQVVSVFRSRASFSAKVLDANMCRLS